MDCVLSALLSSPSDRLPLPGLCPEGGATRATANAPSYHHDSVMGAQSDNVLQCMPGGSGRPRGVEEMRRGVM